LKARHQLRLPRPPFFGGMQMRNYIALRGCLGYSLTNGSAATAPHTVQKTGPVLPLSRADSLSNDWGAPQKEGYAVEKDEDGDLLWKIDGEEAHIIFHSNTAFYLFAKYKKGSKTTSASVNDFNADSYAGTSWLDKNGYPRLSVPIDITGGVTIERIRDHLKNCRDVFKDWLSTVVD